MLRTVKSGYSLHERDKTPASSAFAEAVSALSGTIMFAESFIVLKRLSRTLLK